MVAGAFGEAEEPFSLGGNNDVGQAAMLVSDLQRQLIKKDEQLTELRLESLNSDHRMESMREMLTGLQQEMSHLKRTNARLAMQIQSH